MNSPTTPAGSILSSLRRAVGPAWVDEARGLIQEPIFSKIMEPSPFHGEVLNAGCGEGLFCGFLASFPGVTRIVNVDVNTDGLDATRARARTDRRHEFGLASLTELPFPDATFDGVLCSEVLEHIEDDGLAARELARVTKPGGLLLASVPTPPAPPDPAHVREGYTLESLRSLLGAAGFEMERHDVCFYDVMRAFVRGWSWQRDVLGRGKRNLAPRVVVRGLAHLDANLRPGRPWDLVAVARRRA